MDNPFQSPAVLSLCPGILGLERGTERAIGKIRVAAFLEIEAFIVANLLAGMEKGMVDPAPIWTNIKTFQQVAKHFRGKVDAIMGGFPCQPASLAGKRQGDKDARWLWKDISGIIKTTEPIWCWFENVSGLLSMGYDQVYKDLRHLGYAVESGIFTAEEAGAPHERERLFILAISERFLKHTRRERIGWETWTNINWSGPRSELGNPNGVGFWGEESGSAGTKETISEFYRSENSTTGFANRTDCQHEQCQPMGYFEQGQSADIGTGTMGNADGITGRLPICKSGYRWKSEGNSAEIIGTSKTMAYTDSSGSIKNSQLSKIWTIGFIQPPFNCRITRPGKDVKEWKVLEYSHHTGCRKFWWTKAVPTEQPSIECTSAFNGKRTINQYYHRWPAGPGQEQYQWESPRTVEPGVGSRIAGYNFREDLLRALGNSVVEECAEIAFIELLKKHRKNHELK